MLLLSKPSKFVIPKHSDGTSDGIKTSFVYSVMHFDSIFDRWMDFSFFKDRTPVTSHSDSTLMPVVFPLLWNINNTSKAPSRLCCIAPKT